MIVVSFDKFADFRDELAARLARVREETVRVWIRRHEPDGFAVPFALFEVTYTAVVHVGATASGRDQPGADLLRCMVSIGPYEAKSLDAGECENMAVRTRELHSSELRRMGLEVRGGEYQEAEES